MHGGIVSVRLWRGWCFANDGNTKADGDCRHADDRTGGYAVAHVDYNPVINANRAAHAIPNGGYANGYKYSCANPGTYALRCVPGFRNGSARRKLWRGAKRRRVVE